MSASKDDHYWMAKALRFAERGRYSTHPNPSVGCVIVFEGKLLASGWHQFAGGPHAEANALAQAQTQAQTQTQAQAQSQASIASLPNGTDIYITLEPCASDGRTPPCVDAVISAKPKRVILAMVDPNPLTSGASIEKMKADGIEVVVGVLEAQARQLNCGFIKRMCHGLPFLSVKMACSIDGRSALANGVSQWITGEAARRDVQFQRARAAAILSSARTVVDDNPSLNLRLTKQDLGQATALRHPHRVIVDANLELQGHEKLFSTAGDIWVYTTQPDGQNREYLEAVGATVIAIDSVDSGRVCLPSMMRDLAERGVNQVHSECGHRLAGALIQQGLVDQIVLYQAPHLLGSQAKGGFDLGEITEMASRKNCQFTDLRQMGEDLRLTLSLAN